MMIRDGEWRPILLHGYLVYTKHMNCHKPKWGGWKNPQEHNDHQSKFRNDILDAG